MKSVRLFVPMLGASLALASCGDTDDASSDVTADTVEVPADQAMSEVDENPVEDAEAGNDDSDAAPSAAAAQSKKETEPKPVTASKVDEAQMDEAAAAAEAAAADFQDIANATDESEVQAAEAAETTGNE